MANRRPILPEDLKQLLGLIEQGRLFSVQHWIKAGKKLRVSKEQGADAKVLQAAVSSGFHSQVEELLRARGWSQNELTEALELARYLRRYDIADLLLNHGAQTKQIDFQTCCRELDLSMMERHLRGGTDPNRDNGFAQALSSVKARPLPASSAANFLP